jgi:hypothetical protein
MWNAEYPIDEDHQNRDDRYCPALQILTHCSLDPNPSTLSQLLACHLLACHLLARHPAAPLFVIPQRSGGICFSLPRSKRPA